MKKYLLTIVLILVAVLSSSAAEKMVKEGMRWDVGYYSRSGPTGDSYTNEFAVYTFTGKEVIDGIEYLQLYQTPAGPYINKDYPKEGTMCLMREDEDGTVYIRITEDCIMAESHWLDYTIYPTDPRETFGFGYPKEEIAVFNPDWIKGGDVAIPSFCNVYKYYLPDISLIGFSKDDKEPMVEEDIIFKGKILKRYYFSQDLDFFGVYFIEGIGYNLGLPFLFFPLYIATDGGSCKNTFVSKVYDGNELIFTAADFKTPAYKPMIREDRVWEYWEGNLQMFVDQDVTVSQYRFDGTRDVDGHSYNILKRTKQVTWTTEAEGDIMHPAAEPVVDDSAVEVALLREENGMIWMHRPDDRKMVNLVYNETTHNLEAIENNDNEVVIYNYCAQPEEPVTANIFSPYEYGDEQVSLMNYTVEKSSWEYIPKMGYFNHFNASETHTYGNTFHFVTGVGNVGDGTFFGPMFIDALPDNGQTAFAWFNNQYDLEGNVVFEGRGMAIPKFDGVSAVASDAGNGDKRMYDLMGREISNPLPGTIYIRGGRKYVAR